MKHPERIEQFKIITFVDENYSDIEILYTIAPAGLKLPKWLGSLLSQLGYRRGTFDILFFEARKGYHGLHLEVKTKKGRPSKDQLEWQRLARLKDYKAEICYGREQGIQIIKEYME